MNLVKAVQSLVDERVEFVIIGGWSAILHGSSYVTNALDICCSRSSNNLRHLAKALLPCGPRLRDSPRDLPFVWDEVTLRNGSVFTPATDLGSIDLLSEVSRVGDYSEVLSHSIEVAAFDRHVRTLDLPSLIRAKRAAGREQDLRLLPELESLLDAEE